MAMLLTRDSGGAAAAAHRMVPLLLAVPMLGAAVGASVNLYPHLNDPFANPLQQQAWAKPPRALSVRALPPTLLIHPSPAPPPRDRPRG